MLLLFILFAVVYMWGGGSPLLSFVLVRLRGEGGGGPSSICCVCMGGRGEGIVAFAACSRERVWEAGGPLATAIFLSWLQFPRR